jgi:LPXTG-site transpeptidase (sortase) family protein
MVIAGHSSYYKDDPGRYHTIFSSLMLLKAGDEVRVYDKYSDSKDLTAYVMHRYQVQQSYNTTPTDVQVLLPQEDLASVTLFTCTPIGGISGRRIVK